ncbi:MAG: family 78 glycoside hydrolase catalytic domain [Thermoguttaceae bacterium]
MMRLPGSVALVFLSAATAVVLPAVAQAGAQVTDLRCEYRSQPLGIDAAKPRLSWIVTSDDRGWKQSAYQILAATDASQLAQDQADLWDSGKVASNRTNQVEYQGKPLASAARVVWKVRVWNEAGQPSAWSEPATWSMGLLKASDWKAKWIGYDEPPAAQSMLPPPYLRKQFTVDHAVKKATLYATALGIYEVSINGRRVGRDVLVPGWSDFRNRVRYFTYDVTDLVKRGENAVGAILGDGWYGSYLAFTGKRRFYGGAPRIMLQLSIELDDGAKQVVATDRTWKAGQGPILYADLLMGESRDARKELGRWSEAGFDDKAWKPVTVSTNLKLAVESHPGLPIRPLECVAAKKRTEPKPGVYVFDLGQNMVGWVRLQLAGKAGQQVTVRHAEMLNPDGTLYTANLRAARATDTYILKDGPQVCEPSMTFHGFRYVEVTGVAAAPKVEDVTGVVLFSDLPRTCWFECSHPLVNKLVDNVHWGQKGNYLDVPTDCPQRDERAGWTADAQVFTKTAAFNRDVAAFFTKWLVDLCQDGQRADGAYPDVAPSILGHGNAVWEDAAVVCTYRQYEMYGDTRAIQAHYANLAKFMDHLAKVSTNYLRPGGAYGDWLLLAGPQISDVHGTAYYYYCATLMAEMAQAIGKTADAARYRDLAGKIKAAFVKNFVRPDGSILDAKKATGQTFYALGLAWDLVPPDLREKAGEHLLADLKTHDWHLATGFIGTPLLLPALDKIGRADAAYRILLNETYPSWLLQVKLGSTTMWERWDGWLPNKGFQDPGMNSFNHYWLGCVGEWLYTQVAGLDTVGPGFEKIVIRPRVCPKAGLTWAKVRYDSIRGRIESGWKLSGGKLELDVTIPANVLATVYVPAADATAVTEGGKPAAESQGVKFLRTEGSAAVYEVGSGKYQFASKL